MRSEKKELEGEKVAGTVPGASDYPHGYVAERATWIHCREVSSAPQEEERRE